MAEQVVTRIQPVSGPVMPVRISLTRVSPDQLMSPHRRPRGGLEQAVYGAVADAGVEGATATEVIAAVDPALAYTTVVTTLRRLTARGVLAHARAGRTVHYSVVGDRATIVTTSTAQRMHRLLASAPDREGALAQFVAGLSPADEARITRLLAHTETSTAGPDAAGPGLSGGAAVAVGSTLPAAFPRLLIGRRQRRPPGIRPRQLPCQ